MLLLDMQECPFDHDLGENKISGYIVARFIEKRAYLGKIPKMSWDIHSANPIGSENIKKAMNSADRFWDKK